MTCDPLYKIAEVPNQCSLLTASTGEGVAVGVGGMEVGVGASVGGAAQAAIQLARKQQNRDSVKMRFINVSFLKSYDMLFCMGF